jgi:hypothetical protein
MKLILMTRPDFFVEESQIITALFDEGLELLHVRKPESEPVYSERLLSLIPDNYHKNIVVHDHFYLKGEYGLKGIHLNARNTQLPHNYKGQISCSCQNADELKERVRSFDYVFLSSLFDPTREDGFGEQFSVQKLNEMADQKLIGRKVMAFGNVDVDNMSLVKSLGFGGAVVLGDLWNRFNIHTHRDYKEMITHFRKLRRLAE